MNIEKPRKEQYSAMRALWKEAFGDGDAFLDSFFSLAFSPERCRVVAEGNTVAAALYWFDCSCRGKKIAYLYAVATAKGYRGKGYCHALMEKTHRDLTENGYCGAILVPGEASLFRFYETMGYVPCCPARKIRTTAGGQAAGLRPVDGEAFARLRRQYLPAGAVIQEGENLRFLASMARFYAGEGFLLTAVIEDEKMTGLELLGNAGAAPGIVKALGCKEGVFQIPGGDAPTAMYLPFDGAPAPDYFAFSFG